MKVLVTGGGTAGHVTPLKSIIKDLRKLDKSVEIFYIAQEDDRFSELLEVGKDIDDIKYIKTGKYRRFKNQPILSRVVDIKTHYLNFTDVFRTIYSVLKAYRIIGRFEPDVVFGKGGYVSVPVGLAARIRHIPLVIHESDSRLGFANKILSRYAQVIAFGMPTTTTTLAGKPIHYTGIPLRSEFREMSKNLDDTKNDLGLDEALPVVTISGGSLGAQAINEAVIKSLPQLLENVQIAHITGDNNLSDVNKKAKSLSLDLTNYHTIGFTSDIAAYFKVSSVVVTRASATTFSELSTLAKATILIPAKQLSDQIENARTIADKQAAEVISESDLASAPDLLGNRLFELLADRKKLDLLEDNIKKLAKPNASVELAKLVFDLGSGSRVSKT